MNRTNILSAVEQVGQEVTIMGWVNARRDHGKIGFLDIRDHTGIMQVFIGKELLSDEHNKEIRNEWVVAITGLVNKRPENLINDKIPTGTVEIEAKQIEILNTAAALPFDITEDTSGVDEEVRLKYRYLDLRSERMKNNLIARHKLITFIRGYLNDNNFVEVETPLLTASSPEGARDYLVPSRVFPGKFYALPQSPQQYKQLLMVAGIPRYYQIARCLRDEDSRGDRQPEHTQLDMELSFTSQDEVLNLVEGLMTAMVKELYPDKTITASPWPRLTYDDAMAQYGNDKPDLRKDKNNPNELAFGWVVDFPLFEKDNESGGIMPCHHMFTMPREADMPILESEPLKVKGQLYDMILNGYEMASGSIRINRPDIQAKIFKIIGMNQAEANQKFGHMLDAFAFGAPPHGGIAPGIDRLNMILQNEPNIREVMAFPKTGDGRDPMMGSPSEVRPEQLKELSISITKKVDKTSDPK
jgi:aspartyl-tRNA synthetase